MALSFCLFADDTDFTAYLKKTSTKDYGFSGATWVDGNGNDVSIAAEDYPKYDFVVAGDRYLELKSEEAVVANKITFGEIGGKTGTLRCQYSSDFSKVKEGIELVNGSAYSYNRARDISGKVTVLSPAHTPFLLTTQRSDGGGLTFKDTFSGDATVGVRINSTKKACVFDLGDASQYYGSIEITATNGNNECDGTVTVSKLSAGTVAVSNRCTLAFAPSAEAEVGNLCLSEGATLKFSLPETSNESPLLTVKEDFACAGKVVLSIDDSLIGEVNEEVSRQLMSVPASMVDASVFELDGYYLLEVSKRPKLSVIIDGDTAVVSVKFFPLMQMDDHGDDNELVGEYSSAMTNAIQWTDDKPVHAGAHYQVAKINSAPAYLRTPRLPEGSFTFLGESLTLSFGGRLILACREFRCPLLCLAHENDIMFAEEQDVDFIGNIEVSAADGLMPAISIYGNRRFRFDGELKGTGTLALNSGTIATSYDGSHRGNFDFVRSSPEFSGRILVSSKSNLKKLSWGPAEPYAHVWYCDPKCFGGPLDEFAYNALTLEKMARLITTNKVEFTDRTRGLFLSGIAQLETPSAGDSLTLLQPVTVNGCVYKQGAGTLAMGGELKFLDAEGALADLPPDDAINRTLYVQGGVLKPLSADAFNGLDLVFSNSVTGVDVAIELDMDTDDASLKTYGLRNDRTSSPLALSLAGGMTKVPVRLVSGATGAKEALSMGVMTVKSEIADDVFAKLDIKKPQGLVSVHMSRDIVDDAGSGTSTLTVTLKETGFKVLIR